MKPAHLGIPSYSIFQSEIGAVDRWLERIGRAQLLTDRGDLEKIELRKHDALRRLDSNPHLLDQLVGVIVAEAERSLGASGASFVPEIPPLAVPNFAPDDLDRDASIAATVPARRLPSTAD